MAIEDKLYQTRFNVDTGAHIRVDAKTCQGCNEKPCLYVCPVQNYKLKGEELDFAWQGCVECGACCVVCLRGAIAWSYPRGGFGVCLRYG